MKLVTVGCVAFDDIETPFGKTDKIVGGAGTFISLASSFFAKEQGLISVVGEDFPNETLAYLTSRGVNIDGVQIKKGEKTFGGIADFPSKIDADRQKKTMGIVEKLRKVLGLDKKKDVDEAMDIVKGKNPQGQDITLDVVPTGKGTKTAQNYKQKGIKSAISTTVA